MNLFQRCIAKNLGTTKKKVEAQTYVDFLRQKETYFNRWNIVKNVENDYEKLKQLTLVEEFKICIVEDVKIHIDDRKAENAYKLAILGD